MSTNKYPAKCWWCAQPVGPNEGVLLKKGTRFAVLHSGCNKAYHAASKGKKLP